MNSALRTLLRPGYELLFRLAHPRGFRVNLAGQSLRLATACRRAWLEGETTMLAAFAAEVRPGDAVADVGANIGIYTLLAASLGARVESFEPNPTTRRLLRQNVRLNRFDNVQVHDEAVTDEEGTVRLQQAGVFGEQSRILGDGELAVPATRLPPGFDVVKIDVEGHELSVIGGMSDRPRTLFVELHVAEIPQAATRLAETLPGYRLSFLGPCIGGEHWLARKH